jgi:hypothetical protein
MVSAFGLVSTDQTNLFPMCASGRDHHHELSAFCPCMPPATVMFLYVVHACVQWALKTLQQEQQQQHICPASCVWYSISICNGHGALIEPSVSFYHASYRYIFPLCQYSVQYMLDRFTSGCKTLLCLVFFHFVLSGKETKFLMTSEYKIIIFVCCTLATVHTSWGQAISYFVSGLLTVCLRVSSN